MGNTLGEAEGTLQVGIQEVNSEQMIEGKKHLGL